MAMPFFGQVALSMLFSIKNCTFLQILVTSSKNADMLLIPPIGNWTNKKIKNMFLSNMSKSRRLTSTFFPTKYKR